MFRATAIGVGGEESRNVFLSIVRCANESDIDLMLGSSSSSPPTPTPPPPPLTRRRNPRRSCAPVPSTTEIIESSMTTKKNQKEESPSMAAPTSTPAKRVTRAAARAGATAAPSTGSAPTPSAGNANYTMAPPRRTTRSQSINKATPPAPPAMGGCEEEIETTTTTNANEPSTSLTSKPSTTTPVWLLLVSSSSFSSSSSPTAAIATYRILGGNGSFDNSLSTTLTTSTTCTTEARGNKRRKKERGNQNKNVTLTIISDCSGTATFVICPAAATAATCTATGTSSSFPQERTIATRQRPSLPICLLQPYRYQANNNDPSPYSISSLQFQSLVEANYFSTTLRAVSRLVASSSSELGRRLTSSVDLSAESRPGGSGTASRRHHRQQLANTTADEMLNGSYSALDVDSGTHNRRAPLLKPSPSSKASSSYSSNTKPTTKAEDDEDFYFVTSDDIGKIPTYFLLLLAQAKRSRLNASDISRRSSSVGLVPGTLGIQCRHCCGKRGSGTYFPPNAPKLSRGSAPCLHSHLQRCEACPKIIKAALQKERNRAIEGANDGDAEEVGEHNQQQHWQLLFDRIGDESFDGGDGNSRAVVKAHLSKLLGIKDGDGKRKEEPAVVKTRTASQVDGDMNTRDDDVHGEKTEIEHTSAPAPVATVAPTVTTDLTAPSSNEDMRPPTPDLEMEPFGFSFDADASGKASSTVDGYSRGTGASQSNEEDEAKTTTLRNIPNDPATSMSTTNQQETDEDQYSEWGLSPIPHNDVDDTLIATPTRKFLSSLFNSDNCMTPFALL